MQTAPKTVTYKEIMLVYGLNPRAAQYKMMIVRSTLGKSRNQLILVAEFCKAENVEPEIFQTELQNGLNKLHRC
jgi:hypothetical protein